MRRRYLHSSPIVKNKAQMKYLKQHYPRIASCVVQLRTKKFKLSLIKDLKKGFDVLDSDEVWPRRLLIPFYGIVCGITWSMYIANNWLPKNIEPSITTYLLVIGVPQVGGQVFAHLVEFISHSIIAYRDIQNKHFEVDHIL